MTPFGAKLRELRQMRGIRLKQMAADLGISSAYLSALEHGHRGRPTFMLIQAICAYFNIIWDDAEELMRLAEISHPKITIDTSGLNPQATRLANRLAETIEKLPETTITEMLKLLEK